MELENKNEKKRFRLKIRHFVLAFLAIAVIAAGVFAYNNRENLSALYYAYKNSTEDIQAQQEENNRRIQAALNSLTDMQMRELTDEERKMLENGEITEEEAIELIMGRNGETDEPAKPDPSRKEQIIAQIYVLRADYVSRIDGLIASAESSYLDLPPSERTIASKVAITDSLIAQGNALEGQCDAQMELLLASLTAELNRLGENTAVISEIRSIYVQEKRLKKAALIDAYQ